MASWFKSFFTSVSFSGSLVKLAVSDDIFTRNTVFIEAKLELRAKSFYIYNTLYDPDQEQLKSMHFSCKNCQNFFYYQYKQDDITQFGLKWTVNASKIEYYAFESEEQFDIKTISKKLGCEFIEFLVDESFEKCKSLLFVNSKESNIKQDQCLPDELENDEDTLGKFKFTKAAIQDLHHLYKSEQILFMSAGDLYMHDQIVDKGIGFLIVKFEDFVITQDIIRDGEIAMRIVLNKNFSYKIKKEEKSVEWIECWEERQSIWKAYLLEDIQKLEDLLIIVLFEVERRVNAVYSLSQEDLNWLEREECEDPETESEAEDYSTCISAWSSNAITDSVQCLNSDRILVAKANEISIFAQQSTKIKEISSIPIVQKYKENTEFVPKMLTPRGNMLAMIDSQDPTCVFTMNLDKGKIVSKHYIARSEIRALSDSNKMGSADYIVMTNNQIYRVDPRQVKYVAEHYTYTKNPKLNCIAPTGNGYFAIGNELGEIRLYTKVGQKAKTCFPGFGHSVYSIDSTLDGTWIVATTETYLIAIPTTAYGVNGYEKSITQKCRKARQLNISPSDIFDYKISSLNFTPARFNRTSSGEENSIITSTGDLLIIWNFKSIKRGKTGNYKIKKMPKSIIKNEFLYNREQAIITYKNSIELHTKSSSGLI